MKLAVIPARGGSKRIPRKNVKDFFGQPMIAWSIAAARDSACFDHIVVSTDDAEIAAVARAYGAETPFTRPPELADDHTPTIPVIAHAIQWHLDQGEAVDAACCIYATAPFVRAEDLQAGFAALKAEECAYVFSATSFPFPIQRAIRINSQGRAEMFNPEHFATRSQDLEEAFHDAGQFYWGRPQAWLQGLPIFSPQSIPLRLPRNRVQDIDTLEDWARAEQLFALSRQHPE